MPSRPLPSRAMQEAYPAYLALALISSVTHGGLLVYDSFHGRELWVSALPAFSISVILALIIWSRRWSLTTLGRWVAYGSPVWLMLETMWLTSSTHHVPEHLYILMGLVALLAFTWLSFRAAVLVTTALLVYMTGIILAFAPDALPNVFYVFFLVSMTAFLTLHGRSNSEERARSQHMHTLAYTDPLTGVKNRRGIWQELDDLVRRTQLDTTTATVMLLDIDRFKSINDRFGHAVGDTILTQIAGKIGGMSGTDNVARWGGEEFLILLRHTNVKTATLAAQALLDAIRSVTLPDGTPVTVSIGVAHAQEITSLDAWVDLADQRMYEAKRAGGDQVASRETPVTMHPPRHEPDALMAGQAE